MSLLTKLLTPTGFKSNGISFTRWHPWDIITFKKSWTFLIKLESRLGRPCLLGPPQMSSPPIMYNNSLTTIERLLGDLGSVSFAFLVSLFQLSLLLHNRECNFSALFLERWSLYLSLSLALLASRFTFLFSFRRSDSDAFLSYVFTHFFSFPFIFLPLYIGMGI